MNGGHVACSQGMGGNALQLVPSVLKQMLTAIRTNKIECLRASRQANV